MPRAISIGTGSFEKLRADNAFYVDKTDFIRQWWDNLSEATAIMRPPGFGKTLAMDMVECFFFIQDLYEKNRFLLDGDLLSEREKEQFDRIGEEMDDVDAEMSLRCLMDYLSRYYGKKAIVLLELM